MACDSITFFFVFLFALSTHVTLKEILGMDIEESLGSEVCREVGTSKIQQYFPSSVLR